MCGGVPKIDTFLEFWAQVKCINLWHTILFQKMTFDSQKWPFTLETITHLNEPEFDSEKRDEKNSPNFIQKNSKFPTGSGSEYFSKRTTKGMNLD